MRFRRKHLRPIFAAFFVPFSCTRGDTLGTYKLPLMHNRHGPVFCFSLLWFSVYTAQCGTVSVPTPQTGSKSPIVWPCLVGAGQGRAGQGRRELSEHARALCGRAAEPSSCQCKMCQTHEWRLKCIIASPADMVQRPQKGDASACKHVCSSTPVRHGACPRIYSKVLLCQPPC